MKLKAFLVKYRILIIVALVIVLYLLAFGRVRFTVRPAMTVVQNEYAAQKNVNIEDSVRPTIIVKPIKKNEPPKGVNDTTNEPLSYTALAEQARESKPEKTENRRPLAETTTETSGASSGIPEKTSDDIEPVYLSTKEITLAPEIPTKKVLEIIEYPPLALQKGIEATVDLELYIDKTGNIRKINVLKDPGYGFAQAAVTAITGLVCKPAMANGEAVAVRFRYAVRFTLE